MLGLSTLLSSPLIAQAAPEIAPASVASSAPVFDREGQKLVYFAVLEGLYDLSIPDAVAVSYTHLDVYKRQCQMSR